MKELVLNIKGEIRQFSTPLVMGILNLTPDSFFDGGKYNDAKSSHFQIQKMVDEGADVIDIGAYSSRPGAEEVSEQIELERLASILPSLTESFPNILFSVDTFRSNVAEYALKNGLHIVNDISGGASDERIFEVCVSHQVPYIMMHMLGKPKTMQDNPKYENVVDDVYRFFEEQIEKAESVGQTEIILDPGFGFGKTLEHNYQLLKNLNRFDSLGKPILIGASRKSMINKLLDIKSAVSLNGTTVVNTIALLNGAQILRVHDVKEAKEAVKIVHYLQNI